MVEEFKSEMLLEQGLGGMDFPVAESGPHVTCYSDM
jgi:hypothetical protein